MYKEGNEDIRGRIFSTLPLPIKTHHPAYIHGLFSVKTDRSSLHSGSDPSASAHTETVLGTRWNEALFDSCVVDAWISNLLLTRDMAEAGALSFTGWKHWPASPAPGQLSGLDMSLLGTILQRISSEGIRLLPTVCGNVTDPATALWLLNTTDPATGLNMTPELAQTFAKVNAMVVSPPKNKRIWERNADVKKAGFLTLSSSAVRSRMDSMVAATGGLVDGIDSADKSALLEYVLVDKKYVELETCRAKLLPMKDGSYRCFRICPERTLFPRSVTELTLFTMCPEYIIDTFKISDKTRSHFENNRAKLGIHTNVKSWALGDVAWYLHTYLFGTNTPESTSLGTWIPEFWDWATSTYPHNEIVHALIGFPLIPAADGSYARLRVAGQQPTMLDISGQSYTAEFLREFLEGLVGSPGSQLARDCYTGGCFPPTIEDFLRNQKSIRRCEEPEQLVNWAYNERELLKTLNERNINALVHHLALAVGKCKTKLYEFMRSLLREIPIFLLVYPQDGER